MKSIFLIICVFVISHGTVQSQVIRNISGETIDHQKISIPNDVKGKFTLLCFASSTKAQKDLESWLDPVYQKYIAKTGIMDDAFDVNVFFVPLVRKGNQAFEATMKRKFQESAQADLKPHVLFSETNAEEIITSLNMNQTEIPYLFLLDKDGKIVYRTNGGYTEEKFDKIDELIE